VKFVLPNALLRKASALIRQAAASHLSGSTGVMTDLFEQARRVAERESAGSVPRDIPLDSPVWAGEDLTFFVGKNVCFESVQAQINGMDVPNAIKMEWEVLPSRRIEVMLSGSLASASLRALAEAINVPGKMCHALDFGDDPES
jgi:hypothetical protein